MLPKTEQKERFYGVEYKISEIGGKAFERLLNPQKITGLTYPERNGFIPLAPNFAMTAPPPMIRLTKNCMI